MHKLSSGEQEGWCLGKEERRAGGALEGWRRREVSLLSCDENNEVLSSPFTSQYLQTTCSVIQFFQLLCVVRKHIFKRHFQFVNFFCFCLEELLVSTPFSWTVTHPSDQIMAFDSSTNTSAPFTHIKDDTILQPYQYLSSIPGKDVRGILLDAFQVWLSIPVEKLERIKLIISSLHNAR